ncbi:MAG: hypothetical protein KatS3mg110_1758 [Pirellulaceae bacterium]|nr:MAG: hypothetical protein KatS3mg110_1758 [Pirellulaceae bacterium]
MLTEAEVERSFRKLLRKRSEDPQTDRKIEELLEKHLRPESPLRRRLFEELRRVQAWEKKLQASKS